VSPAVLNGFETPLPRGGKLFDLSKFIRNAEFFDVGVLEEGEEVLFCLLSTVLTVTVVPAGIFLVSDSAFLADS